MAYESQGSIEIYESRLSLPYEVFPAIIKQISEKGHNEIMECIDFAKKKDEKIRKLEKEIFVTEDKSIGDLIEFFKSEL
ncbi:hypothetical protein ACFL1H_02300 [Nanoarchaeota archaeon]